MRRLAIAVATVGLAVGGLLPLGAASASATTEYTTCGAWVVTSRIYSNGRFTTKEQQSCYVWFWNNYGDTQLIDHRWTNYKTIYSYAS
jgi:hypothetical protein